MPTNTPSALLSSRCLMSRHCWHLQHPHSAATASCKASRFYIPASSLASASPALGHAVSFTLRPTAVPGSWGWEHGAGPGSDGGPSGGSPRHPERWDPGTAQTQAENVFFFTVRVVYHQHPTEAVDPHPCSTAPAAGAVPLLPAGLAPAVPTSDPVLSN